MKNRNDDMLDAEPSRYPTPTVRAFSGQLHVILSKGLPDCCDEDGVCEVRKLADALNLRTQTVYKWMRNGHKHRVPKNQIDRILDLSSKQLNGGPNFKPLEIQDLWPYVSGFETHTGIGKKKGK